MRSRCILNLDCSMHFSYLQDRSDLSVMHSIRNVSVNLSIERLGKIFTMVNKKIRNQLVPDFKMEGALLSESLHYLIDRHISTLDLIEHFFDPISKIIDMSKLSLKSIISIGRMREFLIIIHLYSWYSSKRVHLMKFFL